jgi:hypothetical protein
MRVTDPLGAEHDIVKLLRLAYLPCRVGTSRRNSLSSCFEAGSSQVSHYNHGNRVRCTLQHSRQEQTNDFGQFIERTVHIAREAGNAPLNPYSEHKSKKPDGSETC